ncbi:hypothetical protein, partial [Streptomyces sp. NPDC127098]|uniref:hypothetical protein n=1 Tax=Streptomyces sp. NPDC127098 TaxID=3347137 RepID=UPI0036599859
PPSCALRAAMPARGGFATATWPAAAPPGKCGVSCALAERGPGGCAAGWRRGLPARPGARA